MGYHKIRSSFFLGINNGIATKKPFIKVVRNKSEAGNALAARQYYIYKEMTFERGADKRNSGPEEDAVSSKKGTDDT